MGAKFPSKGHLKGAYKSLMNDLCYRSGYENFVQMSFTDFEDLLQLVAPYIRKKGTVQNVVSAGEQLATTLWFLATGDSYGNSMHQHRISRSLISQFIPCICKMIIKFCIKTLR